MPELLMDPVTTPRRTEAQNHFVPYDAPTSRGRARALCGELVDVPQQHSSAPNCPECVRVLAEEEQALRRLQEGRDASVR